MLKKALSLLFFWGLTFYVCAREPFEKQHHFQIGMAVPFYYSYHEEENWEIGINGILVSEVSRRRIYKSPRIITGYLFMPKCWLGFGASAGWGKEHGKRGFGLSPEWTNSYKNQNLYLKADVKFFCLNRKYIALYSSVSLGARFRFEKVTRKDGLVYHQNETVALLDISPFGMRVGNRLYGLLEIQGILSGMKMGIGYRF